MDYRSWDYISLSNFWKHQNKCQCIFYMKLEVTGKERQEKKNSGHGNPVEFL